MRKISYAGRPIVGDPETVAEAITGLAVDGELDSVLLIFPDYLEGLHRFGDRVLPLLQDFLRVGATVAA